MHAHGLELPFIQERSHRAGRGCPQLANLNSARQLPIADKTLGKSYSSANLARTKSVCRQIEAVHPTNNFL